MNNLFDNSQLNISDLYNQVQAQDRYLPKHHPLTPLRRAATSVASQILRQIHFEEYSFTPRLKKFSPKSTLVKQDEEIFTEASERLEIARVNFCVSDLGGVALIGVLSFGDKILSQAPDNSDLYLRPDRSIQNGDIPLFPPNYIYAKPIVKNLGEMLLPKSR